METTLMPWKALPSCATLCGHLFDANGACVPPAQPTASPIVYDRCFCSQSVVQPFKTGVSNVCDSACTAPGEAGDITSIRNWFTSFCAVANQEIVPTVGAPQTTIDAAQPTGVSVVSGGGGGNWVSTHWQWVIMLVVLVVGLTALWIGACLWRRAHLRRRDRLGGRGKGTNAASESGALSVASAENRHSVASFMPGAGSAAYYGEKPKEPRKWVVEERT